MLLPLHFCEQDLDKRSVYQTKLDLDDVLLMASDGINNLRKRRIIYPESRQQLSEVITVVRDRHPEDIQDIILQQTGSNLTPIKDDDTENHPYDDVTFVIVKKTPV